MSEHNPFGGLRLRDLPSLRIGHHRRSWLGRIVDQWWERVYALIFEHVDPGEQASQYAAGEATRDYVWNTIGQALWGGLFPILTVVTTRLVGTEQAGQFNLAFTVATLLLFVANYGVRTYQVSDLDEMESFAAYVIQRVLTCAVMLAAGALYCAARGYDRSMLLICGGAFAFRALDALADVFEGRLQQTDKLYLAGISCTVRTLAPLAVFAALLLVSRNVAAASVALAVASLAALALVTIPLALLEAPRSRTPQRVEVVEIFRDCFPAFAALFLFNLIESMPKFAMEGVLPYEDQVYFSALFFPAQTVLMIVGFVYKPQLVRLAGIWADSSRRPRFDLIVLGMIGVCAVVAAADLAVMATVGIPLSTLMYGFDFEPLRQAQYLMVVAGGFAAGIDFLFQILTVLRAQASATLIYLGAFVLVGVASVVGVRTAGFMGAIWSYLAVMVVLFALLAAQYLRLRLRAR